MADLEGMPLHDCNLASGVMRTGPCPGCQWLMDHGEHWTQREEKSAAAKLRELTALLCTEEGQDVAERAKGLQSERLILLHKRETLVGDVESLRAALAEKDAAIDKLVADAKRSGYVAAIGALHNAMPLGFVETDADRVIGRVAKLAGVVHEHGSVLREALAVALEDEEIDEVEENTSAMMRAALDALAEALK